MRGASFVLKFVLLVLILYCRLGRYPSFETGPRPGSCPTSPNQRPQLMRRRNARRIRGRSHRPQRMSRTSTYGMEFAIDRRKEEGIVEGMGLGRVRMREAVVMRGLASLVMEWVLMWRPKEGVSIQMCQRFLFFFLLSWSESWVDVVWIRSERKARHKRAKCKQ